VSRFSAAATKERAEQWEGRKKLLIEMPPRIYRVGGA